MQRVSTLSSRWYGLTVYPIHLFTCGFYQIVDWYLGSVRLFSERLVEKDKMIEEKDKMIEEKDKRIEEKDEVLRKAEEFADVATALREIRKTDPGRKWGKYTSTSTTAGFRRISRHGYSRPSLEQAAS